MNCENMAERVSRLLYEVFITKKPFTNMICGLPIKYCVKITGKYFYRPNKLFENVSTHHKWRNNFLLNLFRNNLNEIF